MIIYTIRHICTISCCLDYAQFYFYIDDEQLGLHVIIVCVYLHRRNTTLIGISCLKYCGVKSKHHYYLMIVNS